MENILTFLGDEMNGDSWENLCNECYRIYYKDDHYTEIPAASLGDAGIEGFTASGIVTQCYCPERKYSDDELYEHQRDKMTKDIGKLLKNRERLKQLGVPVITEWHFLIPEYKDKRILEHAEQKRKEVLEEKRKNPLKYDYISEDFRIWIKTAANYRVEITRLIRGTLTEVKLNLAVLKTDKVNWSRCDSEKVENIKRKVKAIIGEDSEDLEDLVNMYMNCYINGIEILNMLREDFPDVYEDIVQLEQTYRKEVRIKTMMNTNKEINSQLFNKILDAFGNELEKSFKYLNSASIMELKLDIVAGWLADCSMKFRG